MPEHTLRVLQINASGRQEDSATRQLGADLIAALEHRHNAVDIVHRDVSKGVPFVDDAWITANFTPDDLRTDKHREALSYSDTMVRELQQADVLIFGAPIYNFSIPATLKAWVDMVARARLTFRYTANGPVGLLEGKKAYLIIATGGVPIGSPVDFATPYLRHALNFLGITDIEVIAADRLNSNPEDSMDRARAQIADLVHLGPKAA